MQRATVTTMPEHSSLSDRQSDVLIVGGGNAGLCAALKSRESGASVTILESAPVHFRAGNSRHTRNMRCMSTAYGESEYFEDLLRVTDGETNAELARLVTRVIGRIEGVDGTARRTVSEVAQRHAPSGPDQRFFPGRREGFDEHVV